MSRREGDLAAFWANSSKVFVIMGWKTERNIKNICKDTWRWHKLNPTGCGIQKLNLEKYFNLMAEEHQKQFVFLSSYPLNPLKPICDVQIHIPQL